MSKPVATTNDYLARIARVREEMTRRGVDAVLLSVGHDLPYLTGYHAMPLERLTMLVVGRDGVSKMIVPRLEVPRVVEQPGVFTIVAWNETDNPVALVAKHLGNARTIAVGDQMTLSAACGWPRTKLKLQHSPQRVPQPIALPCNCMPVRYRSSVERRRKSPLTSPHDCLPKVMTSSTLRSSRPERTRRVRTTIRDHE
ncbi:MAG: hypothetical protein RIQ63_1110 [Actinomycetota bacterium]